MNKLVIIGRDGVIIENPARVVSDPSTHTIKNVDEVKFISGSPSAICMLQQAGFMVVVASNQSGIGQGVVSRENLLDIQNHINGAIVSHGGKKLMFFNCAHIPDDPLCACRKPQDGLLLEIEEVLNRPITNAPFIGDSLSDLQAGFTAGCEPMLVRTGDGEITQKAVVDDQDLWQTRGFRDLNHAAQYIISKVPKEAL